MLHCISACCTVAQDPPLQVHLTAFIALSGTTSTLSFSLGTWYWAFIPSHVDDSHMPENSTHILLFKLVTLNLIYEFGHNIDPKLLKKLTRNRLRRSAFYSPSSMTITGLQKSEHIPQLSEFCMFFIIFKDTTWVTGEREDRTPVRREYNALNQATCKILRKSCIFRTSFSLVPLIPPRIRVDVLQPPLNHTGMMVQIGNLKL